MRGGNGGWFKRNRSWYIYYTDPNKKDTHGRSKRIRERVGLIKRNCTDKIGIDLNKVKEILADRLNQVRNKKFGRGEDANIEERGKTLFSAYADTFLTLLTQIQPSTRELYRIQLLSLNPHFGDKPLNAITGEDVKYYRANRLKKVKPATVNREVSLLRCIFNEAMKDGYLRKNPASNITLFDEHTRRETLTDEQTKRLFQACNPELLQLVKFALFTGCRRGEIMGLRWSDVYLKDDCFKVRKEISKSKEDRTVPLNQDLRDLILSMRKHEGSERLFISEHRTAWENAKKKAGLKDFRFHDLRHCMGTNLARRGTDIKTIANILGHSEKSMYHVTMRYINPGKQDMIAAMKRVEGTYPKPTQKVRHIAPTVPVSQPDENEQHSNQPHPIEI